MLMQAEDLRLRHVSFELFNAAGNKVLLLCVDGLLVADAVLIDHAERVAARVWPETPPEIYAVLRQISGTWHASFWNPDLTFEKMCGNAMRSIAQALFRDHQLRRAAVMTPHGPTTVGSDGVHASFSLSLSAISIRTLRTATRIDVGTPHFVFRCEDVGADWVAPLGNAITTRARPRNATFYSPHGQRLVARTFERGVGETASCGTGAIAATLASGIGAAPPGRRIAREVCFVSGEQLHVAICPNVGSATLSGPCISLGRVS